MSEGRKGAMPFHEFESIVREAASKPVSIHYSNQGAAMGLPKDVVTVAIGDPDAPLDESQNYHLGRGCWWNVRRGDIPERNVYDKRPGAELSPEEEQQLQIIEALDSGTMSPASFPPGYVLSDPRGRARVRTRLIRKMAEQKRLRYIGWRETLRSMLSSGYIRETKRIREWLGAGELERIKTPV